MSSGAVFFWGNSGAPHSSLAMIMIGARVWGKAPQEAALIRHIVLIQFRDDVSDAQIAELFAALEPLQSKIESLRHFASGRSHSPEKIERGYKHGFTVDFDDWDALQRYQDHPDHKALGAQLIAHAQGGLDGILVFDLEMPETAG